MGQRQAKRQSGLQDGELALHILWSTRVEYIIHWYGFGCRQRAVTEENVLDGASTLIGVFYVFDHFFRGSFQNPRLSNWEMAKNCVLGELLKKKNASVGSCLRLDAPQLLLRLNYYHYLTHSKLQPKQIIIHKAVSKQVIFFTLIGSQNHLITWLTLSHSLLGSCPVSCTAPGR